MRVISDGGLLIFVSCLLVISRVCPQHVLGAANGTLGSDQENNRTNSSVEYLDGKANASHGEGLEHKVEAGVNKGHSSSDGSHAIDTGGHANGNDSDGHASNGHGAANEDHGKDGHEEGHESHEGHRFHVAKFIFDYVKTPFIVGVWILYAVCAKLCKCLL